MLVFLRRLVWVSMVLVMGLCCGQSFAGPMYVMIEPVEEKAESASEDKGVKVCVVVRDGRDENVVATQMLGLLRNAFGGAVGMSSLRNEETLDVILAHGVRDRLRFAGYDVVKVYPDVPEHLSSEYGKQMKGMKKQIKAARKSQARKERRVAMEMRAGKVAAKKEKKAAKKAGEEYEPDLVPIVFRDRGDEIVAQGGAGWTNGADIVVEVVITDFASDNMAHAFTIEILGWSLARLSVGGGEGSSGTISVADIDGFGRYRAFAGAKASWKSTIKHTYNTLLGQIESAFLQDDFEGVVSAAQGDAVARGVIDEEVVVVEVVEPLVVEAVEIIEPIEVVEEVSEVEVVEVVVEEIAEIEVVVEEVIEVEAVEVVAEEVIEVVAEVDPVEEAVEEVAEAVAEIESIEVAAPVEEVVEAPAEVVVERDSAAELRAELEERMKRLQPE